MASAQQSATLPVSAVAEIQAPTMRGTSPAAHLLQRRVDSIDWVERTFEEVVDWIGDQSDGRVNVIVRWGPLNVEGVGRETLVTLRMTNSTVAHVLNETLDQLSESGELAFRAFGNTLWLSSRSDFGRKLYLRIYDVADILFHVPDFGREAPVIDLQQAGRSGGGGGGGGGGGSQNVFGGSSSGQGQEQGGEQAEKKLDDRLKELRDLIERVVEPSSWTANGGRGQIDVFNRTLIVYNTIEVHEMIAGQFSYGG
jgi:hypothetical protein